MEVLLYFLGTETFNTIHDSSPPYFCLSSQISARQPSEIRFTGLPFISDTLPDFVFSSSIIGILKGRLLRHLFELENKQTWRC